MMTRLVMLKNLRQILDLPIFEKDKKVITEKEYQHHGNKGFIVIALYIIPLDVL